MIGSSILIILAFMVIMVRLLMVLLNTRILMVLAMVLRLMGRIVFTGFGMR